MKLTQSAAEQWAEVVQFYEDTHPWHRQEPMKALVRAVADAGVAASLWPGNSHFSLTVSVSRAYPPIHARLSAQYWHEVNRFQIRYYHIQGIPYDEKWCELAEAQATLRHLFRKMQDREAAPTPDLPQITP